MNNSKSDINKFSNQITESVYAPELPSIADIPLKFIDLDQLDEIDLSRNHIVPAIFHTINETLANSENLISFLNSNIKSKKWFIASDYALGNPEKKSEFITFTLIPQNFPINSLMSGINKLQYSDIKKTKFINPAFLKFINSGLFFHISIQLPKEKDNLIPNIRHHFQILLKSLGMSSNSEIIKSQVKFFQEKLFRANKNELLLIIEIISCVISSINLQLFKSIPDLQDICWFSDRDNILTTLGQKSKEKLSPMIFHIVDIRSKYLFQAVKLPFSKNYKVQLSFGKPEFHGKMWYDPLIRIPDYIAGTLADNDQKNMTVTKEKFSAVIREAISDSKYHFIFKLSLQQNTATAIETQYKKVE
ncbi:hypothetical protein SOI81_11205 [Acinetobacter pittii]|uniref:hypothetical protein n=1 Tax=Acinetobacter pittii TaxID=48296 RepID=UPI002A6A9603|nr:hypothetical protein [Acinetobacter pittii]WPP68946.1 hypothetical protein SOI81_11205 [Acinetobacter pittii]